MEGTVVTQIVNVLAIDDEEQILEIMRTALEDDDYVVHGFTKPQEGIAFYAKYWRSISVVLLDFMLPDMRGDQVYEQLKRINPNVHICLVSSCDATEVNDLRRKGLACFLKKPFHLDELVACVQSARCSMAGEPEYE